MFQVVQRAVHSLVDKIWKGSANYAVATGSANTYAVTLSPAPASLTDGFPIKFKVPATNTGASTLAANGLPAKSIVKMDGVATVALAANDLIANEYVSTIYRLTQDDFLLISRAGLSNIPRLNAGNVWTVAQIASGTAEADWTLKTTTNTEYLDVVLASDGSFGFYDRKRSIWRALFDTTSRYSVLDRKSVV